MTVTPPPPTPLWMQKFCVSVWNVCPAAVPGFLPLSSACCTPALPVPLPGDVHVLLFRGREGDFALGGQRSHAAAVRQPPGTRATVRHGWGGLAQRPLQEVHLHLWVRYHHEQVTCWGGGFGRQSAWDMIRSHTKSPPWHTVGYCNIPIFCQYSTSSPLIFHSGFQ